MAIYYSVNLDKTPLSEAIVIQTKEFMITIHKSDIKEFVKSNNGTIKATLCLPDDNINWFNPPQT